MTVLTAHTLNAKLPYASPQEIGWLVAYPLTHPNAQVVMLGGGPGIMTLALLQAGNPVWLLVVEKDAVVLSTLHAHLAEAGVARDALTTLRADSAQTGAAWESGAVDLLIVDADHSQLGVALDLAAWWTHVAPQGLVFLHDYHRRGAEWDGVKVAWEAWADAHAGAWALVADVDSARIIRRVW